MSYPMIKRLFIGVAVSTVLIYLTFKGVDLKEVLAELHNKSYGSLLPIAGVFILIQIVRSIRWGVLLSRIEIIDQKTLFPITCVGFMAIVLAPVRMGELVRPYLVSLKRSVPMGSGMATVLVERVMDVLVVVGFLFLVLLQTPLPPWLVRGGEIFLAIIFSIVTIIVILVVRREALTRILPLISSRLPQKISVRIEKLIFNLINGFRVISDARKLFQVLSLSFFYDLDFVRFGCVYAIFLLQSSPWDYRSHYSNGYNGPGHRDSFCTGVSGQFSIFVHRCLISLGCTQN